jgi:hypothetical protein
MPAAAIDYELAPGAEHVDVRFRYASPRDKPIELATIAHAVMYTERTPVFQPRSGFTDVVGGVPYLALVDEGATSWADIPGEGNLGTSLSVSGFLGAFSNGFDIPACTTMASSVSM